MFDLRFGDRKLLRGRTCITCDHCVPADTLTSLITITPSVFSIHHPSYKRGELPIIVELYISLLHFVLRCQMSNQADLICRKNHRLLLDAVMVASSCPVEILEYILDIYEEHYIDRTADGQVIFRPKRHLLPLLRLSKLWHIVSERRLYRCISIEGKIKHKKRRKAAKRCTGVGALAAGLLDTLSTNLRLASLVEELRLGIRDAEPEELSAWTRMHVYLVVACPNLQRLVMKGFASSERDTLVDALKQTSLVSFYICPNDFAIMEWRARFDSDMMGMSMFFELIPSWPEIQSLALVRIARRRRKPSEGEFDAQCDLGEPWSPRCCPNLRSINLFGNLLRSTDIRVLREMCDSVAKLNVDDCYYGGELDMRTFSECLCAWSPTLESLHIRLPSPSYQPILNSLSALNKLTELHIHRSTLPFDYIAHLAQLEQLCYVPDLGITEDEIDNLCDRLEHPEEFCALVDLVIRPEYGVDFGRRLKTVCRRRGIKLERWEMEAFPGFLP